MPLNPKSEQFLRSRKQEDPVEDLLSGILSNDQSSIARAITLVESRKTEHKEQAARLVEQCLAQKKQSRVIGITGTPGVGKSTFIEAFGALLISSGKKVAVLAIDPSSSMTKGSILGDKTRMDELSRSEHAFIRPSPSAGSLGGVARTTRESIFILEAAGYDYVLIETVGVGQSETQMSSMVDFFMTLLQPNAGDELQGIKRGIMELSDLIVINKVEQHNLELASLSQQQYKAALHLFPARANDWVPEVLLCSAQEKRGISDILETIDRFYEEMDKSEFLENLRTKQNLFWYEESLRAELLQLVDGNESLVQLSEYLRDKIRTSKMSPLAASRALIEAILNS
jgi:LAO/AO transport system kinase